MNFVLFVFECFESYALFKAEHDAELLLFSIGSTGDLSPGLREDD